MADKTFFRIRVKPSASLPATMVQGLGKVTKSWQIKTGKAVDFVKYSNLEVQTIVKQGNSFVPVESDEAPSSANTDSSGTGGSSNSSPAPASQEDKTANQQSTENSSTESMNFSEMSVEQLKSFLTEHGVLSSELRGAVKADLIIRAEAIISHQSQEQLLN